MRYDYRQNLKTYLEQRISAEFKTLHTKVRGRSQMLGEKIDDEVKQFIKNLFTSGDVVNTTIVVAASQGLVGAERRALLKENGGHMDINRDYARSVMRRMNLLEIGTKTACKLCDNKF